MKRWKQMICKPLGQVNHGTHMLRLEASKLHRRRGRYTKGLQGLSLPNVFGEQLHQTKPIKITISQQQLTSSCETILTTGGSMQCMAVFSLTSGMFVAYTLQGWHLCAPGSHGGMVHQHRSARRARAMLALRPLEP